MKKLLTTILVLAWTATLLPATIHVPDDYPTIQEGIDAALDSDTVMVGSGVYHEHLSIVNKALVLTTEFGPDSTDLSPPLPDIPVLKIVLDEEEGMEVSGFFINGGYWSQYNPVVWLESQAEILVRDNRFDFFAQSGVYCLGPSRLTGNVIERANGAAVILSSEPASQIVGNTFIDCYTCISVAQPGVILNNIFVDCIEVTYAGTDFPAPQHNLYWLNNSTYTTVPNGNLEVAPMFCDYENGDYQTYSASPCVPSNNEYGEQIGALGVGCACECGDFDCSGFANITDAVYMVSYIFREGPPPFDSRAGDINCDGQVDATDIVYLIGYIFSGGPAPCAECE